MEKQNKPLAKVNKHCECDGPGYCQRHGVAKGQREFELCAGINCKLSQCARYFKAWEEGLLPGQSSSQENPKTVENARKKTLPRAHNRGMGDTVASAIKMATFNLVKPCPGCKKRQAWLNHHLPTPYRPVRRCDAPEFTVRNCLFHIWPVKGYDAWRWNCDQLLKRRQLFNGRRIVSIVVDDKSEPAEAVQEYLKDFTDEFLVFDNEPKYREVVSFPAMLEQIESLRPYEITFFGHSKCVRHDINSDNQGSTVFDWTRAMYETVLDYYPLVQKGLMDKAMVGSFKRHGEFKTPGNHRWHYSGTFYWFRHDEVFNRNWRYIDSRFFGVESWPGHMFVPKDTGVLFADNVGDLYKKDYWDREIQPRLDKWKLEHKDAHILTE